MRTSHFAVPAFLLLALAGCSAVGIESKRVDYKSGVTKMPLLEVPPDLTTPAAGDRYTVPENGGEIVAVYSDYSKGGTAPQSGTASNVLPAVKNVHLERNGPQRWLVVENRAENVWPVVKAFWQEHGFAFTSDNPEAGLIETDWAENRAKIPQGGLRAVIGKVFDKLYSSGEKDMYRTRLERSKDGNSTEIYISHQGMEEVLSADKTTSKWQPRPNDPELEAAMLQLLMVRLGGSAPDPAVLQYSSAVPAPGTLAAPKMQEGGLRNILLSEPFDKCWRKVGLALEQADITVDDKDRAKGEYYLGVGKDGVIKKKGLLDRLMFWRNEEGGQPASPVAGDERYQVFVRESGTGCLVGVLNPVGGRDDTARRITESLFQQLIK